MYRLDHVAIGVFRIASARDFVVGELGGRVAGAGPSQAFFAKQWSFEGGGKLELLEPAGPPGGFMHRFVQRRGPGLHHVTFKVPDFEAAAEHVRSLGYELVGYRDNFPGWKEFFLHPRQAQGIVLQFAYSPASPARLVRQVMNRLSRAPVPPVRLVGMRVSAPSVEAALGQWGTLAKGDVTRDGDTLLFRWPDSPLRIAVDIDAERTPGPICLEIDSGPRELQLPAGPHPVLGTEIRNLSCHPS